MRRDRLSCLLIIAAFGIVCGAGCSKATQDSAATPQLSASDKQKMDEMSRQANINFRSAQINRSNLPPAEKKRLLDQISASGGK